MHRFLLFTLVCFVLASCGTSDVTTPTGSSVSAQQPTHAPQAAAPQSTHTPRAAPTSLPTQSLRTTDNPYPSPLTDLPIPDPSEAERNPIRTPHLWRTMTPPPPVPDAPLLSTIAPPQATEPLTRFFVTRGDYNQTTGHFSNTFAWVDIQTGAETIITALPHDGPPPYAVISPDHHYVAYLQSFRNGDRPKLYVRNLSTHEEHLLADSIGTRFGRLSQQIFWSADSQKLAYSYFADQSQELKIYHVLHNQSEAIATLDPFHIHGWMDSTSLLLSLTYGTRQNAEIWRINVQTKEKTFVTTYPHRAVSINHLLAPNKQWIFLAYEEVPSFKKHLFMVDLETETWIEHDNVLPQTLFWTAQSAAIIAPLMLDETLQYWNLASSAEFASISISQAPKSLGNIFEIHASPDGHWLLFVGDPPNGQRYKDWYTYNVYHIATDQWQVLNADQHWFLYRIAGW